jgi:hypothetical protein
MPALSPPPWTSDLSDCACDMQRVLCRPCGRAMEYTLTARSTLAYFVVSVRVACHHFSLHTHSLLVEVPCRRQVVHTDVAYDRVVPRTCFCAVMAVEGYDTVAPRPMASSPENAGTVLRSSLPTIRHRSKPPKPTYRISRPF